MKKLCLITNAKGDLVAWVRQKFIINDAVTKKINNKNRPFCGKKSKLFVFPQRSAFKKAKALCQIHGGSLVIPETDYDQEKIFSILSRHKTKCLDTSNTLAKGKEIWLGMERIRRKWYKYDFKNKQFRSINYTNWDPEQCTRENCGREKVSCPYMYDD